MSWISRSLTGLLQEKGNEGAEEGGGEFWDDPELFDPAKSVKDDLSELRRSLTQSLWGVAAFLAPPPAPASQPPSDQPDQPDQPDQDPVSTSDDVSSPKKLTGIQSDFAELKGGFAKGLSRLSSVIRGSEDQPDHDHGLSGLLKPIIDSVLNETQPDDDNLDAEDAGGILESEPTLPGTLASHIDGISKLASSLFPFVSDDQSDDVAEAPGLTPEVLAFASNISKHPETWLDFPLASEDHGFEMSTAQAEHANAVEYSAQPLAALKIELCPAHMSEERFWKIYFVLLHSRLSEEDAALLSTSQILEARSHLLNELRKEQDVGEPEEQRLDVKVGSLDADGSLVIDKDAIPSTVKLSPGSKSVDESEADEWLAEEEASGSGSGQTTEMSSRIRGANDEDDVSFSDLEDDEEKAQRGSVVNEPDNKSQGWVELRQGDEPVKKHERVGSNDWLTVDKEDV